MRLKNLKKEEGIFFISFYLRHPYNKFLSTSGIIISEKWSLKFISCAKYMLFFKTKIIMKVFEKLWKALKMKKKLEKIQWQKKPKFLFFCPHISSSDN